MADVGGRGPFGPATGKPSPTNTPAIPGLTDIAIVGSKMYGMNQTELLSIDLATGKYTVIGTTGHNHYTLEVGANDALYSINLNSELIRLDPKTGKGTVVGPLGGNLSACGDLMIDASGTLFATLDSPGGVVLATIDPKTGAATKIGDIGYPDVYGAVFLGSRLVGGTETGDFLEINVATGRGTLLGNSGLRIFGMSTPPVLQWPLEKTLNTSDPKTLDHFGRSASATKDLLAVGRLGANGYKGKVHLYEHSGGGWNETVISGSNAGGQFGAAVSVSKDFLAVGAHRVDISAGQVHIFRRSGGPWKESTIIKPATRVDYDCFGAALAHQGDTLVVGAPGFTPLVNGKVYVFKYAGGKWTETIIVPKDIQDLVGFGSSVDIEGDTIVVGMRNRKGVASRAYVFKESGSSWTETMLMNPITPDHGEFGNRVAISGDRMVVSNRNPGRVHVFRLQRGNWGHEQTLTASDGKKIGYWFGDEVDIDGTTIVVGDCYAGPTAYGGQAYIFTLGSSGWTETKLIQPAEAVENYFGSAVAVAGDVAVVGAFKTGTSVPLTGQAHIFRRK